MKIYSSYFIWGILATITCFPLSLKGGIFFPSRERISAQTVPKSSMIFQKNLGATNPVLWARKLSGTANSELFLSSVSWQNTRADIIHYYKNTPQVQQYLTYQEYLFRKAIRVNNIASARSVNIKGDVGESITDWFYQKDGWEKIDGKRGRNGFDGLYVKRNKSGAVIDWIAAEAKTGTSKPGVTKHGIQGSQEWKKYNVSKLLEDAQGEYQRNPSLTNKQRLDDLTQIAKLSGRGTHFHKFHIVENKGKIYVKYDILASDFSTIKKSQLIDMQVAKNGQMQQMIYKKLESCIFPYDSKRASLLVKKIEKCFKRGTIKSDSDLYRLIKREIPNKQLAYAVAQELGDVPPRGSLAVTIGKTISKNTGIVLSAAVVAGFTIAHDVMRNGITSDTFMKAGVASAMMVGTAIFLDSGMNMATRFASEQIAKYLLSQSGRRVTARAIADQAGKLAPTIGRGFAGALQIAFSLYFIGDAIHNYYKGNITQTEMIVHISIVATTTAVIAFFTKSGAEIGTAICPGAGTFIGMAIGIASGLATGGYEWYVESKKQERLLVEAQRLANWETENNKRRLAARIQELEEKAARERIAAWQGLLPAD